MAVQLARNSCRPFHTYRLAPGLIHIKGALSREEQIEVAFKTMEIGCSTNGFWKEVNGQNILNSTPHRGRMYLKLDAFPEIVSELFTRTLYQAIEQDPTLKFAKATHEIVLYYKTLLEPPKEGYIPWHQDNGENDGEADFPVVSFSLGDACDFLINEQKPRIDHGHPISNPKNLAHRVYFESGDALIFGGASRFIWHSIFKIYPNTAPEFLPFKGARINFTFRNTPGIIGHEDLYATVGADTLGKDNRFFKLSKME